MFLTTACNAKSDESRFEDYKNQEEFEAKIKEMFPIGGDFEDLKGQVSEVQWAESTHEKNLYGFIHSKGAWWPFSAHYWVVGISIDPKSKKILKVSAQNSITHL